MRLRITAALGTRVERLAKPLGIVLGLWFWIAFGAMFFTKQHPLLDPFVTWTIRLYFGLFIGFVIAIVIVAPGVYAAKELFEFVEEPGCSRVELQLTWIWAGSAGLLLTALLGTAAWLIMFGPLADVKLWFIGLCWTLLLIPWWLIGYLGRRLLRSLAGTGKDEGVSPDEAAD
jgi:hypothetical protein